MNAKHVLILSLVLGAVLAAAWADGGGGLIYGLQTTDSPLLEDHPLGGSSPGLIFTGGYGYAVSGHRITGGFGAGLADGRSQPGIVGGYGGIIRGARGELGPLNLMITSWTGIGGIRFNQTAGGGESSSYLILSEEIDLEIGLVALPWFMPVLYAGYQVMGNVAPGRPFGDFLSYTPVVGVRLAFGRF